MLGLDALGSAAYGPEAALSLLIPLGLLGVQYLVPITAAIIALLVIVFFSYRQTIEAYPSGGGSYTWTVAALDDRVKVAAPVAGMTDLRNYVVDGAIEGHCGPLSWFRR